MKPSLLLVTVVLAGGGCLEPALVAQNSSTGQNAGQRWLANAELAPE